MTGRMREAVHNLVTYRRSKSQVQPADTAEPPTDAARLESNENPRGPASHVQAAIARAAMAANRYPDHLALAVRTAIGKWLRLDPSRVAVGCGSVGLLQQLWLAYIDPGDEVVFPWPSFEVYPIYTRLVGGIAVTPPLEAYAIDPAATVARLTVRTKMLVLASPNNPTGTALDVAAIEWILRNTSTETLVVVDQAYNEYCDERFGDPVPELLDGFDHLVVLRSFSKAYGLAGIRVGYALAHPSVVTVLDRCLIPFAVSGVAQAAAIAAIEVHRDAKIAAAATRAERTRVTHELRARGWLTTDSQTNFIFLPLGAATDSVYTALERRGVLSRPFSGLGLRVTIGEPSDNNRFLEAIKAVSPVL